MPIERLDRKFIRDFFDWVYKQAVDHEGSNPGRTANKACEQLRAVHVFRATVSKEAHLGQQLQALAEKLTEGSMVPFVMHLVESKQLSPRERKEIRELLRGHKSARKTRG